MAWNLYRPGFVDIIDQVPVESIKITEVGPGGVSSMTFTIDDPTNAMTLAKREEIRLINAAGGDTFRGFVEIVTSRPVGPGREIDVELTGAEAVLDNLIGNATGAIAGGSNFQNGVNQIIVNKTTALNASMSTLRNGDDTDPIGDFVRPALGTGPFLTEGVGWTPDIGTLRQQIEQFNKMCSYNSAGTRLPFNILLTVDFGLGVRCWEDDITLQPDDWTTLTVLNTTSGTVVTETLQAVKDYTSVIDRVYVIPSTVAAAFRPTASGSFTRREAILEDAVLDTANERDMAGDNFLLRNSGEDRGEFDITDWAPTITIHAGSLLDLTDAVLGIADIYRIMEIRKTFHSTFRQDWHVTYGRPSNSLAHIVGRERRR